MTEGVPFEEIERLLSKNGWKLWGRWKHWAVFIKPSEPGELPLLVYVTNRTVPADECDRIKRLLD